VIVFHGSLVLVKGSALPTNGYDNEKIQELLE
jgi:hypothetical protein